jgi:hypothetical protein
LDEKDTLISNLEFWMKFIQGGESLTLWSSYVNRPRLGPMLPP